MVNREKLEQEREKLYSLILEDAPQENIQHQSEVVDKHIVEYYKH